MGGGERLLSSSGGLGIVRGVCEGDIRSIVNVQDNGREQERKTAGGKHARAFSLTWSPPSSYFVIAMIVYRPTSSAG